MADKSHKEAMKIICRYLNVARGKGINMIPRNKLYIDWYVDSDLTGLCNYKEKNDPTSAKSINGFLFVVRVLFIFCTSKFRQR